MNYDGYDALERAAFNSYDPEQDGYDPDNATGPMQAPARTAGSIVRRSPAQPMRAAAAPQANFTIQITSDFDSGDGAKIELFSSQYSISDIANGDFVNYKPLNTVSQTPYTLPFVAAGGPANVNAFVYGYFALSTATITDTLVYWGLNGELVFLSPTGITTVQCKEIPYRALLRYSGQGSFTINRIRMTATSQNQFANDFTTTRRTFLGATTKNTISPNNYFSPDQFQTLRVDIPEKIKIDKERGMQLFVNANETINLTMSIGGYTQSAF